MERAGTRQPINIAWKTTVWTRWQVQASIDPDQLIDRNGWKMRPMWRTVLQNGGHLSWKCIKMHKFVRQWKPWLLHYKDFGYMLPWPKFQGHHPIKIVKISDFHILPSEPVGMRGSRNFHQGGSRSVWQKKLWQGFFFYFFSPQLILQKSNGQFQRNLSFFKVPEGVQHFPGGGGGSNFFQGGGPIAYPL